ncbi:5'-methylthioadenosine nucleosidase / S-adenosylhomocysteine nucleosidase [gamma proteobacterium IMCC2047]|nr:5'-methylthioadenosine nucleosidase / S-adenosylhomocysteine nucleosidase [gamma proteobacterium IMCC2047]
MTEKKIANIAILMAMQGEAAPLIQHFQLQENQSCFASALPFRCFQKQVGDLQLNLLTSGTDKVHGVDNIGCEPATLMAQQAIDKLNPDLLISAGTAGGFAAKGAQIGTLYASEKYFVFHDRIVPLPKFDNAAIGCYPALDVSQLAADLKLESGVISSGSSLEKNPKDQHIIEQYNAVAKEMEAAAIAWVASLYKTPFFALKSITNLVDESNQSEDEFIKNFDYSVTVLNSTLIDLVHYLQGKTINSLGRQL